MNICKKTFELAGLEYTLETGRMARQADGAVLVSAGETSVLVNVTAAKDARTDIDFFPLTVHYQERMYANGKIPGGFFKREGRPPEVEVLTSRLIDRPIRPLFPEGFRNEVQIIAQVVSYDPAVQPDILALIGASAAMAVSGIPFNGPLAALRIGFKDGDFMINPSAAALEDSLLNLIVAGTEAGVLMVESEADQLPEEVMLGAVLFGHENMQVIIQAIKELVEIEGASKAPWDWKASEKNVSLVEAVKAQASDGVAKAYALTDKAERVAALSACKEAMMNALFVDEAKATENNWEASEAVGLFKALEKDHVRGAILAGELRIDGRDTRTVRPIHIDTSVLPRVHGSTLFTRGETQALVAVTLGSSRDAQLIDAMASESKDSFMLHYNFPPYSVGEVGRFGTPGRREIGHGKLARRALEAVLPGDSPYTIRVVSEITESNGSSSMATVCGASLAMMDAGVPLKAPVAGIAMGLIKDGSRFAVLTDILGDEDHLGDMDFKVAGTAEGVTALQMDIKIDGVNKPILESALEQAKEGRMHILNIMLEALGTTRTELSKYAPRILEIKIKTDKIRDVIGKGGATIKGITEQTGATVEIEDDGTVKIFSSDQEQGECALAMVTNIVSDPEIGRIYDGKVVRIVDFGAFVSFMSGKEGLVHISQICEERVEKVTDYMSEGQDVKVKVVEIDRQGRVRLSMKGVEGDLGGGDESPAALEQDVDADTVETEES